MKRVITDADLDRLLTARRRGTTPDFERRLAGLVDEVARAGAPAANPKRKPHWAWWIVPLAAAAGVAVWLPPPPAPASETDFELLIGLDADLAAATPLLDTTNRELCLEMPTPSEPVLP